MTTLIDDILYVAKQIETSRTLSDIMQHTTTELGELQMEVIIAEGKSYKQPGKDGVIGEAIDLIICAVDLIHKMDPNITEQQLQSIADRKLLKWEQTAK
jgi:hypothetical protein